MAELVKTERAGPVATIWLDNPPVNAASGPLLRALHAALDTIETEPGIRCVILTAAGERAFCAGGDLHAAGDMRDSAASAAYRALTRHTLERIETFPRPIITAIHGWCIGGGTAIAWSADLRLAADTTVFRTGDAYLGLIPSWGMGLLRLPRLIGRSRALDLLLLGEDFGAQRAYELGLVTKVVPRASLLDSAQAMACRVASASPAAILATRRALQFNLRHDWDETAHYEETLAAEMFAHPDAEEGMSAFLEKRAAVFRD